MFCYKTNFTVVSILKMYNYFFFFFFLLSLIINFPIKPWLHISNNPVIIYKKVADFKEKYDKS